MFTGNNTSVAINYAIIYNFELSKEPDLLERFYIPNLVPPLTEIPRYSASNAV